MSPRRWCVINAIHIIGTLYATDVEDICHLYWFLKMPYVVLFYRFRHAVATGSQNGRFFHCGRLSEDQFLHYGDVAMSSMAYQITSLTIVRSNVYSDADQRKHQSSASLAFARGNHQWQVTSPHKRPVTRKMLPFDDVIMLAICLQTFIQVLLLRLPSWCPDVIHNNSFGCPATVDFISKCQVSQKVAGTLTTWQNTSAPFINMD